MATTVGNLRVFLNLDRTQYSRELQQAQREGQQASNAIEGAVNGVVGGLGNMMRVGTAAFAALTTATVAYSFANSQNYVKAQQFEQALYLVAQQMGYTREQIDEQVLGMTRMGASTVTAQQTVMGLMRSRLDATRATELYARAEDIAVTSGKTGQEVIEGLIHGITTQNALVLRNAGVTIDADKAMRDYAASIGKTVGELTSQEKQQAYMNAVLAETNNIQGVAQRLMQEGVFNWQAMRAPMTEIGNIAGSLVEPAMSMVGRALFFLARAFIDAQREGGVFTPVIELIREVTGAAAKPISDLIWWIRGFIQSLTREDVQKFADTLRQWMPVLGAVTGALVAFGSEGISNGALGPLGRFLPAVNPVIGALIGIMATQPGVTQQFIEFGKVVLTAGAQLMSGIMPALQALVPAFLAIIQHILPVIPAFIEWIELGLRAAVPAIQGVATAIGWLFGGLNWLVQNVPGVAHAFGLVAAAALGLVIAFKGMAIAQSVAGSFAALATAMGWQAAAQGAVAFSATPTIAAMWGLVAPIVALSWPILAVVAGAALLGAAFVLLYRHCEPFRNMVNWIWEGLKQLGELIAAAFKPVLDLLGRAIGFVVEHWKAFAMVILIMLGPIGLLIVGIINLVRHFDTIKDAVATVVSWLSDKLTPVFMGLIGPIGVVVSWLADKLGPVFRWIADNILPAFAKAVDLYINGYVIPILTGIGWVIHKVADFFQWLFDVLVGGSIVPDLVNGIVGWFRSLTDWVTGIVSGLASFLAGIWGAISATAQAIWSAMVSAVTSILSGLWSGITGILSGIASTFSSVWSGIVSAVTGFVSSIFSTVTSIISNLWSWLTSTLSGIGQTFQSAWQWIWDTVSNIVSGIQSTIQSIWSAIWSWIQSIMSSISETFRAAWQWIWDTISNLLTGTWNTINSIWSTIWQWLNNLQETIKAMFNAAWQWIWDTLTRIVTGIWNTIVDWFTSLFRWLFGNAEDLKAMLNSAWTWIWDKAAEIWGKMWETITGWAQRIWDGVTNTFYSLRDTVVSIFDQIVDWVKQRLNWVIEKVNGFIGLLNTGLDTFGIPKIGELGYLAKGGVTGQGVVDPRGQVAQHAMYMVGEQGVPETVIPWNRAYRDRAKDLWELTGEKLGLFETCSACGPARDSQANFSQQQFDKWLREQLKADRLGPMGGPGGSQGHWWDGDFPMTQGPGGQFSHSSLAPSWDYSMPNGTPIKMGLPGVVVNGPGGGYGVSLGVNLDQGGSVVLGHLQSIVKTGRADVGELIAYSDNTGFSTGPHMHIEFRNTSLEPGPGGGEGGRNDIFAMIKKWAEEILGLHEPHQGDPMAWAMGGGGEGRPFTIFGSNERKGMLRNILLEKINIAQGIATHLARTFSSKFRNAISGLFESGEGGTITKERLWELMDEIGFNADKQWAARVVACESKFNCGIIGPQWNGDGGSIGLWQIQPGAHPSADREKLKDCAYNTAWAKRLYDERGPAPWSCKALGGIVGLPEFALYDRGGMVGPGPIPVNATGRSEMVLNERTYTRLINALEALERSREARPEQHVTFNQEYNNVGSTADEVVSDVLIALRTT